MTPAGASQKLAPKLSSTNPASPAPSGKQTDVRLSSQGLSQSRSTASFVPYGLPTLLELLRVVTSLLNPLDLTHTDSMRLSALGVLNSILDVGGRQIGQWDELIEGIKDDGCRYLFQVSVLLTVRPNVSLIPFHCEPPADPFRQPANPGFCPANAHDAVCDVVATSQTAIRAISHLSDRSIDTNNTRCRTFASDACPDLPPGFFKTQFNARFRKGKAINTEIKRSSAFCSSRHPGTDARNP